MLLAVLPGVAAVALGSRGVCPPRSSCIVMAQPEYIFEMAEDRSSIRFGCRQRSLTPVKPEAGGSLQEFIGSDASAIVMSSWDAGQVEAAHNSRRL